ncbi:MAG: pyridoxamine 5'-phosphate oxidase family protein [Spirochaetaceae bacterium]|jgi:nitroimidazol reductase NimA-like FMN-containing flavoprotein (pyridoxamine 5'-phosphate oxidase superfamily)|nr:pyridoxamine 5'-phosphate oxidase family protein [Spirochaetaceae bacterium]
MRRKDREITDINEKIKIIDKNKVCRLALSESDQPYIVPLNYGYSFENDTLTLYFHGANKGRKLQIVSKNKAACFEIDCDGALIEGDKACEYGYAYKSIIGTGKIVIVDTADEKMNGLNELMKHQTGKDQVYRFDEKTLEHVTVYKMVVGEFTGKERKLR